MVSNAEAATLLDELADRLLLQGESWFKVGAYRRAATTLRETPEDIASLAASGSLQQLSGVGKAIATKIENILTVGSIPLLERLRQEQSQGLLRLLRQTSLTPKQIRALASSSLAIDSPESLTSALESGEVEGLGLIDHETEELLRAQLAQAQSSQHPA